MYKVCKKFFVLGLSSILTFSSFSNVCSAKELSNDTSGSSSIHFMAPSSSQANALRESNINPDSVVVVNKNEIFPESTLKVMQKEDQELAKQGLIKKSEVFYMEKTDLAPDTQNLASNSLDLASDTLSINSGDPYDPSAPAYDYQVKNTRSYVNVGDLNDKSAGLRKFLDISFNIFLESVNIVTLSAASILGISPSSFMSYYVSGDRLLKVENIAYNDNYYMWYDRSGNPCALVRTTNYVNNINIDLYQANKQRISNSYQVAKTTKHRYDQAWIEFQCRSNKILNGMACTLDRFFM